jgi:SAM-dependent methyltransferase
MTDIAAYIGYLETCEPLRASLVADAIAALHLPPGSRGLDAGCGIGLPASLLAAAVGPTGHVTALDIEPACLRHGQQILKGTECEGRITWRAGDLQNLPFDDRTFDWAWSCDCVGGKPDPDLRWLRELARVVRLGGTVAILIWSSETLLPGYPRLEAHPKATAAGLAPFADGMPPETHWLRTLGSLRRVGIEQPRARTFAGEAHAPLSVGQRRALADLLEMRWPGAEEELAPQDRAEFLRLCRPESPDFILDRDDYYGFFTYSLFWGRVGG